MEMCRASVSLGNLLRLGLLLTALCVCLHIYLDSGLKGIAAPRSSGAKANSGHQNLQDKQRIFNVHAVRNEDQQMVEDDPSPPCCPPLHLRRKAVRRNIDLQPWAAENRSLEDEAKRFLSYITTPQVSCASLPSLEVVHEVGGRAWAVCLDPKHSLVHRMQSKHCRAYSFGLGMKDRTLERFLSKSGCEVHCFDPSLRQPHLQEEQMWLHRLSVDWRDPNPGVATQRQNTKKVATILNDFGHIELDVLKADMESAEWKILENLILEGVLDSVGQLLLELHLHWAGFEVGGEDPDVVRYWFSLLKELERADFRLFHVHSDPDQPRVFLRRNVLNASSSYTLNWVNKRWKPSRM